MDVFSSAEENSLSTDSSVILVSIVRRIMKPYRHANTIWPAVTSAPLGYWSSAACLTLEQRGTEAAQTPASAYTAFLFQFCEIKLHCKIWPWMTRPYYIRLSTVIIDCEALFVVLLAILRGLLYLMLINNVYCSILIVCVLPWWCLVVVWIILLHNTIN